MPTPKRKIGTDPAEAANKRVLEDIRLRDEQKQAEAALAADIGLNLKPPEKEHASAAEFLADEFDRKNYGDPTAPTYTRTIYGPDNLLVTCPHMKMQIEKIGLEPYAQATAEAIKLKGEKAATDPVMQRGLRAAILRYGVEQVAQAFFDRIMKIPVRTVEVEADREDALLLGRPLEEAVERYGTPGMAPKFLSDRCITQFGMRGYKVVLNEQGDPVRVGTLIMAEIPEYMAERRRRHWAEQSNELVRGMEAAWNDSAQREIAQGGGRAAGLSVLGHGESVHASAAGDFEGDPVLTESYLGRSRETGFRVERQR